MTDALGGSALFAARFRENAARALLLPRRRPGAAHAAVDAAPALGRPAGRGQPLRLVPDHARDLPRVLRDVFDLPALREVLRGIRAAPDPGGQRRDAVRVAVRVGRCSSTTSASYMYEGDAPLAERRAQALALDRELLAELLGEEELRELLDPAAIADLELELQGARRRTPGAHGRRVHDLLRRVGDLRIGRGRARVPTCPMRRSRWPALEGDRRIVAAAARPARRAGSRIEDVARYRDACRRQPAARRGRDLAGGSRRRARPLDGLLLRWARTHAPFTAGAPAGRWGVAAGARQGAAARPGRGRRACWRDRSAPASTEHEFADPEVMRSTAPPLAGAPAARGRAGADGGAGPLPARHGTASAAGHRARRACSRSSPSWRATRSRPRSSSATSSPARVAGYTPAPARRARRGGGGGLDRRAGRSAATTAAWRSSAASGPSCWPRPAPSSRATAPAARCTTPSASSWSGAARPSSPHFA